MPGAGVLAGGSCWPGEGQRVASGHHSSWQRNFQAVAAGPQVGPVPELQPLTSRARRLQTALCWGVISPPWWQHQPLPTPFGLVLPLVSEFVHRSHGGWCRVR